jgi:hypothetical protein
MIARKSPLALAVLLVATVAAGIMASDGAQRRDGGQRSDDRDEGEHQHGDDRDRSYAIGLWGDVPYNATQATVGVPNLIADMNRHDLAFTVHDGDLKSGSSECTDAVYTQALGYFNSLRAPAMFTPGDNDWTDCDRTAGYSSLAQLDKERALFFSTPFSLGIHRMRQQLQTDVLCLSVSGPAPCVENRRWRVGGVTYATLNIQGSCNNLCDTAPSEPEYTARNNANIVWMQETFQEATARRSDAVMLISQGNPGWDLFDGRRAPYRDPTTLVEKIPLDLNANPPTFADSTTDGFHDFLAALRTEVVNFRKPVVYVHGDSHYFRVDKPFQNALGQRLENFTRVETFGDNQQNGNNDVAWVKVHVDTRSDAIFSYEPRIVAGNRTAVPAP